MFGWLRTWTKRRAGALMPESRVVVEEVNGMLTATYPDGAMHSVAWDDLQRIEIHTNDTGPWGADVWWVLEGQGARCAYPQGATGEAELIPKYQALDGFDNERFIEAMGCTANKVFLCWERAGTL